MVALTIIRLSLLMMGIRENRFDYPSIPNLSLLKRLDKKGKKWLNQMHGIGFNSDRFAQIYTLVPPTVMPSIFIVGWPTPTGTL